jgi:hypothetical protein
MNLLINGLVLELGEDEENLVRKAAAALGIAPEGILDLRVVRRSIDARRARPPRFVYRATLRLAPGVALAPSAASGVTLGGLPDGGDGGADEPPAGPVALSGERPVVVGGGPAGLFAALILARQGLPPLLLERGKPIPERLGDVRAFWERGVLDPESHVHFGEGGAGTFSDGKLTSRANHPHTAWVKRVLVEMGAPADILVDAHPHIGTDRLRAVVLRLRERLVRMGCEVRFGARVTDFIHRRGEMAALVVNGTEEIRAPRVLLAIGQSADDTYRQLAGRGIALAPKPFAIGLRVEHPQEAINRIQYGRWAGHPQLPAADYFLTARLTAPERSVYSFCMCPGGRVIGCSAQPGGVITNGMSRYRREGPFANSAVVVNVRPEDLGEGGVLAGLAFRRHWEEKAFGAGGGDYRAPAQRLTDFLAGREGEVADGTSFLPGVRAAALQGVLPEFVTAALKKGFAAFERKMPGFITREAVLIGVETRTSAPVRIVRGEDGQSANTAGLFPCGEGAGYAGGIVSAALDGIRAAQNLVRTVG